MTMTTAVEKVRELTAWQNNDRVHPFTCGNGRCPAVQTRLVPTVRGWICQYCNWTQPLFDAPERSALAALKLATTLLTSVVASQAAVLPSYLVTEIRDYLDEIKGVELS